MHLNRFVILINSQSRVRPAVERRQTDVRSEVDGSVQGATWICDPQVSGQLPPYS